MSIRNRKVNLETGKVRTLTKRESAEPSTGQGIIITNHTVTVRDRPSEYGKAKGYLQGDTVVDILGVHRVEKEEFDGYYKIRYDRHQVGYVNARFIRRC